ncbi:MAG: hypothetical protein LBB50_03095 [Oscillospiraceae bacterium]|nr:hypothetical protein [Oscillospiraceae bacterium]
MKKFGLFAFVMCLLVLAVTLVLSATYPAVYEATGSAFGFVWEGLTGFASRFFGALYNEFAPT